MRRELCAVGVLAALLAVAGCGVEDDALARVGDDAVTLEAYQSHLAAVTGEPWQAATAPVASRLLDQFLDQEVIVVAAQRDGQILVPAEPGARSARVRLLIGELCGPPAPLDRELIEERMRALLDDRRPARAHVRQMLLDGQEEAESARQQLDSGADFVELSQRVSRAPNADGGGDLGFLTQGSLSEDLDEVIFSLAAGEISEPVPGPSGFHIFQVLEVIPAGPRSRAEVEPEVVRNLEEAAAREHARDCVRRLAGEVGVEVIRDNLWFEYDGRYAEGIRAG
jgi:hypothetical protein